MISEYTAQANTLAPMAEAFDTGETPLELREWLSKELTEEPDYYLDEVYEQLKEKYRPVLHIDNNTMLPVHDDTHLAVLDLILERFNTYEDNYYGGE